MTNHPNRRKVIEARVEAEMRIEEEKTIQRYQQIICDLENRISSVMAELKKLKRE